MGTLYIVATPIGNLEDITVRAIKTLLTVPVIACEDTRRTGQLLKTIRERYASTMHIPNTKEQTLISYYNEVEEKKTPELLQLLEDGAAVALVSDAGTPLISDPGYTLVRDCIKRNVPIRLIPGPSSVTGALSVAGLPTDQWLFLGYLPTKTVKRKKILSELPRELHHHIHPTVVLFESPHRLNETLTDIRSVFGDIDIVIARELTKIHEEIWRGKVSETPEMKGEIVILFHPTIQAE